MNIGIIGSGTMGAGIAQVAAQHGCSVFVVDTNENALRKATENLAKTFLKLTEKQKLSEAQATEIQQRIVWTNDKQHLSVCNLVIEAIVENLEVKQSLFTELESIVSEKCILASNTSSLSITSIASACKNAERVIGIHFFNPAPLMELVEIIPALQTSHETTTEAKQIIDSWKKKTVLVKDTPGFIVNRIARPFYSEAIRIFEEGIATKETIDYAMKHHGGFKMGPFELMDMIGHDVNYVVTETVWKSFFYDTKYTPSFTQKRLVEAKWFGKKSGKGFYDYSENAIKQEPDTSNEEFNSTIFLRVVVMLINEAYNALYLNIASKEDIETAMTKGVNYPKGLIAWGEEIGVNFCVQILDDLYHYFHEDRYRCCPLLRNLANQK